MMPSSENKGPTSWPWIELSERGTSRSLLENNDPMDLIDEYDSRPAIRDLLSEHQDKVSALRRGIRDDALYSPRKHDELWLLRFLLSHKGKVQPALAAAKSTLLFRQEHDLDSRDIRQLYLKDPSSALRKQEEATTHPYTKHLRTMIGCCEENAIENYLPDESRGVIHVIRVAGRDQHKMMARMTQQEYLQCAIIFTEWTFQWLDAISRKTGRLTKNLRVVDAKGAKMSMINKQAKKWDGQNSALMEDKYPQLLESVLIVNPPTWISLVFKLFRVLAPKRVLEKVSVIDPLSNKKDKDRCLKSCAQSQWPKIYGGDLEEWPTKKNKSG